jgi:hypothetical protein
MEASTEAGAVEAAGVVVVSAVFSEASTDLLVAGCTLSAGAAVFSPAASPVGALVVVAAATFVLGCCVMLVASSATPKPAAIAMTTASSASISTGNCFDTAVSLLVVLQHAAGS